MPSAPTRSRRSGPPRPRSTGSTRRRPGPTAGRSSSRSRPSRGTSSAGRRPRRGVCERVLDGVLRARPGCHVLGIDYIARWSSSPASGARACPRDPLAARVPGRRSVRSRGSSDATFDLVVTTRVLINLGSARSRRPHPRPRSRMRPGGLLLLSEATVEGLERLNSLRPNGACPTSGCRSSISTSTRRRCWRPRATSSHSSGSRTSRAPTSSRRGC